MDGAIIDDEQKRKLTLVKKAYLIGFIGSVFAVVLGLIISSSINAFYPLSEPYILILQAMSAIPASTALFGVRGWDIQTWGGKSPAEILNQKLFIGLSTISLLFPVITFSLTPLKEPESTLEMENRILKQLKNEIFLESKFKIKILNQENDVPQSL